MNDSDHLPVQVKSAARLLDLMETLSVFDVPMRLSEIARRLSIPKSSAYMLVSTLERRGYVISDDARRYRLVSIINRRGREWVGGWKAAVLAISKPAMEALWRVSGESVFLGMKRDEQTLEYVHKLISPHEVRCDADLHEARWLHSTSVGLVILAFQHPSLTDAYFQLNHLERLTDRTPCDVGKLRRIIEEVREQGYAVTRDTNAFGASGVAAPIFMRDGSVAALNLAAPTPRFDRLVAETKRQLLEAAKTISQELTHEEETDVATIP